MRKKIHQRNYPCRLPHILSSFIKSCVFDDACDTIINLILALTLFVISSHQQNLNSILMIIDIDEMFTILVKPWTALAKACCTTFSKSSPHISFSVSWCSNNIYLYYYIHSLIINHFYKRYIYLQIFTLNQMPTSQCFIIYVLLSLELKKKDTNKQWFDYIIITMYYFLVRIINLVLY